MFDIDWDAIASNDDVVAIIGDVMDEFGFSGATFAYTPISNLPGNQPGVMTRALTVNIDAELVKSWYRHQESSGGVSFKAFSQTFDPVRRKMSQQILPERIVFREFLLDRAAVRNVVAANWIRTLMKVGIRESFYFPVFTGRGEFWGLGALRYDDNPNHDDLTESQYAYLNWVVTNLAEICIGRLNWRSEHGSEVDRPLTPRELDCLFWAAHGYSSTDTAEVLELNAETVRKHIKNAAKKLNARGVTQTVFLAYRMGYLQLA